MKILRKKLTPLVTEEPKAWIYIYKELCKGYECQLCVSLCPKSILGIGKDLKVEVVDKENCIACFICELHCPDFAIFIEKKR